MERRPNGDTTATLLFRFNADNMIESMRAEWDAARVQAARIRDDMLPLAAQRRDAALAAYAACK